jgi:hypothetical protein
VVLFSLTVFIPCHCKVNWSCDWQFCDPSSPLADENFSQLKARDIVSSKCIWCKIQFWFLVTRCKIL